jgi:hypothetical protein
MPDPASFPSSEFDHARAEVLLQESDFARPDAEIKARGGEIRCALRVRKHREMSNCYRAADFFVHTDRADSAQRGEPGGTAECGLAGALLFTSTNQYDMYCFMSFS